MQLEIFENEQFGQVRTTFKDGDAWFVGRDVAKILGYKETSKAVRESKKPALPMPMAIQQYLKLRK